MDIRDEILLDDLHDVLLWTVASEVRKGLHQARLPLEFVDAMTRHLTNRIVAVLDGRKELMTDDGPAFLDLAFRMGARTLKSPNVAWGSHQIQSTLEALLSEPP